MGALEHIRRLTENGEDVRAEGHPAFVTLMEVGLGDIAPDLVVARRRTIETLGSNSIHLLTLQHLSTAGIEVFTNYTDNPPIGRLTHRLQTDRPFVSYGRSVSEQWTELSIEIDLDGTYGYDVGASVPFDKIMEAETRSLWAQWGVGLSYQNTEKGGQFAMAAFSDSVDLTEANLAAMQ